jgi:hypothetical protein
MRRRWNLSLWLGILLVPAALAAYMTIFIWYPPTRDVPWAPLVLIAAGLVLIGRGLVRAWREPQIWRGRIAGSIVGGLAVGLAIFSAYGLLVAARDLPASSGAPRVGDRAPDFTLPDSEGRPVTLAGLLAPGAGDDATTRGRGALLIFYRGYW